MQKLYPDADLVFISGADAIAQITTWKDSDQLWPLAHFVAVSRPGHQMTIPVAPEGAISILEIPALAISSTDIRARAQTGKPVWYLVSDGVVQYIAKNKLYGQND
jgi:nicotinate-nucleotide adenylyltransferase